VRKLSIGRSFRLALVGLALVLAVLAALAAWQLYDVRRDYETSLSSAYALEAAAGQLLAAGIAEQATLQTATPAERAEAARRARTLFAASAAEARALAREDPASARLVDGAIDGQRAARAEGGTGVGAVATRTTIAELIDRQHERRDAARADAASDTRRAIVAVAVAGLLALVLALAVVTAILNALRRPLDELVKAAGRLADGDLAVRVRGDLRGELAELAQAFNAMAEDLERAQRALAEERERLAVTVESLGDGLLVVEEGRVVTSNLRASELLGVIAAGTPLEELPQLPSPLDALAGEVVVEDGRRTLAISATRLGVGSRGLVWTIRDVSERMRLERVKTEFVATASHELRSPLTSIKGFVELLHNSRDLTERQREWVEIVLVSANRLADLVNDLLDVARLDAGRMEIHARPTDVADAIREVARLLGPRIADRGQRLALDLPTDLSRAMADPARLRQIVTNLLTNAHQYTGDGGQIAVRAAARDGAVTIAIADTGRGMSAEQLEHVFERFYRGGGTGVPGTGLGLSIVRSLVDLQGGTIDVASRLGEGTTFTVALPRARERGHRAALAGRRVLVVDDDDHSTGVIVDRLERLGVEAVAANGGAEAMARLRSERFDAMTLDVLMPGMTGFEVLRTVRADPRLRGLPVVVVSVFSAREALSGEWVVDKPIDADELTDALRAAMLAGRVRVLAVGRPAVRGLVAATLDELGIEFEWAADADDAARRAAGGWFEVALVDAGMDDPRRALERIELRGRRLRRSVVVFSAGDEAPGIALLDAQPIPIADAGAAVLAVLRAEAETEIGG
jgi:signal transduction histidine kinase/DNA-binding response OmpR family regulator